MGKYMKRKKHTIKPVLVLASLAVLVLGFTLGTLAYLSAGTEQINNSFTPSRVTCVVEESFDQIKNEKKEVTIKNTGDTTAFIRASVVVTWQRYSEQNKMWEIYQQKPVEGVDYTINWYQSDEGWFMIKHSDEIVYYYYEDAVAPGASTAQLIQSVIPEEENYPGPEYTLCVEILSSAIQYVPEEAVEGVWPDVKVDNGKLKVASSASVG